MNGSGSKMGQPIRSLCHQQQEPERHQARAHCIHCYRSADYRWIKWCDILKNPVAVTISGGWIPLCRWHEVVGRDYFQAVTAEDVRDCGFGWWKRVSVLRDRLHEQSILIRIRTALSENMRDLWTALYYNPVNETALPSINSNILPTPPLSRPYRVFLYSTAGFQSAIGQFTLRYVTHHPAPETLPESHPSHPVTFASE